jgi:pyrroloquinoline quinone biosynthesis protein E
MHYLKRPIVANFVTTRNCNMDCVFCGVEHLSSRRREEATSTQVVEILDKLKESGILQLNFFGGEPLMYHDIERIVRYGKDSGFYQSMVTNARLLTPQRLDWLVPSIDAFAVSLHGTQAHNDKITRRPGSFQATLEALKTLRSHTDRITVNMTVTNSSITQIAPLIERVYSETGILTFAMNRCIGTPPTTLPNTFSRDDVAVDIDSLLNSLTLIDEISARLPVTVRYAIHFPYCLIPDKSLQKYVGGCGVGVNYLSVDLDGWVQMCSYTQARMGNILVTPLLEIWNEHPEYVRFRVGNWLPERCRECEHLPTCMAGCKMSTGSASFAPDVLLWTGA